MKSPLLMVDQLTANDDILLNLGCLYFDQTYFNGQVRCAFFQNKWLIFGGTKQNSVKKEKGMLCESLTEGGEKWWTQIAPFIVKGAKLEKL